jgi:hypothetical protein
MNSTVKIGSVCASNRKSLPLAMELQEQARNVQLRGVRSNKHHKEAKSVQCWKQVP